LLAYSLAKAGAWQDEPWEGDVVGEDRQEDLRVPRPGADPGALAEFWEQALGVKRLGAAGNYVLLASPSGALPKVLLQQGSEPNVAKNRMHLDIETTDVDAEVERLKGIGARCLEEQARTEHGRRWMIMVDPEGNEFCVCDGGSAG